MNPQKPQKDLAALYLFDLGRDLPSRGTWFAVLVLAVPREPEPHGGVSAHWCVLLMYTPLFLSTTATPACGLLAAVVPDAAHAPHRAGAWWGDLAQCPPLAPVPPQPAFGAAQSTRTVLGTVSPALGWLLRVRVEQD